MRTAESAKQTSGSRASKGETLASLDLYAQAGMQEKRLAQSKLVDRVLRKGKALA